MWKNYAATLAEQAVISLLFNSTKQEDVAQDANNEDDVCYKEARAQSLRRGNEQHFAYLPCADW
jgi:hypothetical protein